MSCNKTKQKTKKKKIISKPTDRAAVGGAGRGVIFKAFFSDVAQNPVRSWCSSALWTTVRGSHFILTPMSLMFSPVDGGGSDPVVYGGLTRWSPEQRAQSDTMPQQWCLFFTFFFSYKLKRKHLCSHFYCIKSTMRVWTPAHNPPPKLPPPLWLSLLMSCWITRSLNVFKVRGGGGPGSEF